jgi:hypothetical protein
MHMTYVYDIVKWATGCAHEWNGERRAAAGGALVAFTHRGTQGMCAQEELRMSARTL